MTPPGRDVNSVDEIVVDRDPAMLEAVIHDIELHSDVLFTWDYERSRTALVKLDTSEEYGDLDAVAADRALAPRAQV